MTRVLLTGMSGTGKSTLVRELSRRGYAAVDTDLGWCQTGPDGRPRWREDRIERLLARGDGEVLFVAGCQANQVRFYARFDHIVLLRTPRDVLVERLRTRTGNPYGKRPDELARVLADLERVEPRLRRAARHELDTTPPAGEVVTTLLALLDLPPQAPRAGVDAVVARLLAAGCVAAEEEADELVAAAPDRATLEAWVRRRERGEPLAWITGSVLFCGRTVLVDSGVYVPRFQTEELARRAAALLAASAAAGGGRAADLCTGAGAVAAHLRADVPGAAVVGVDLDPRAAACARRNGVPTVVGDLGRPLRPGAFDVVTAVPPYVPTGELGYLPADVVRYEPHRALDGGDDGLVLVRRVVAAAADLLRPGGWLVVEIGGEQDRALGPALSTHGFAAVTPWSDEEGDLRGLAVQALGS